ncbi:MAG TPA: transglutaminase domain-containing protein [Caulobacteraceae bacterium]|nr:transglutaminase domain-containing protein [Caulobacteraceae bacterium]
MPLPADIRAFYTATGPMTDLGPHAAAARGLPSDIAGLCDVIQGDLVHHHWAGAYKVELTPAKAAQQHLRGAAATLDALLASNPAPLGERREPAERAVGVCRHFSVVAAALLRAQGVPARARVGFGAYFEPGKYVDHWVVERWSEPEGRWILTDAQLDALQRQALKLDFDPLDVPRDRFIIAGDAWTQARAGEVDASKFGIFDMWGLWFIAGNVLRDFAALNNVEMLPWDVWGPDLQPNAALSEALTARFDQLAALTLEPDARFAELRALYEGEPSLRVPAELFNAVTQRVERVAELA